MYLLTKDVWKGVWQSAAESAALGGVLTGVVSTTRVLNHKQGHTVNKSVKNFIIPKNVKLINNEDQEEEENKQDGLYEYQNQYLSRTLENHGSWVIVDEKKEVT